MINSNLRAWIFKFYCVCFAIMPSLIRVHTQEVPEGLMRAAFYAIGIPAILLMMHLIDSEIGFLKRAMCDSGRTPKGAASFSRALKLNERARADAKLARLISIGGVVFWIGAAGWELWG